MVTSRSTGEKKVESTVRIKVRPCPEPRLGVERGTEEYAEIAREGWAFMKQEQKKIIRSANLAVTTQMLLDGFDEILYEVNSVSPETRNTQFRKVKRLEHKRDETQKELDKEETSPKDREKLAKELEKLPDEIAFEQKKLTALEQQLSDLRSSLWGSMGLDRQAISDRLLKKFVGLAPGIRNRYNNDIVSTYKKHRDEIWSGERSISSYKKSNGLPVSISTIKWLDDEHFLFTPEKGNNIYFRILYGHDKQNAKSLVQRFVSGEMSHSAPTFVFEGRNLFLAIPYKGEKEKAYLDPARVLGVDLGITVPAYVSCPDSAHNDPGKTKALFKEFRKAIGNVEGVMERKKGLHAQRRRLQLAVSTNKGGKGREKKLRKIRTLGDYDRRVTKKMYEKISWLIVESALIQGCGVIRIELLTGMDKEEKSRMGVQYWSPALLIILIQRRASKVEGLTVVEVDPSYTSQRCSVCGHIDPGNRPERDRFKCLHCKTEVHPDWNAARNIASWARPVSKRNECLSSIRNRHDKGRKISRAEEALLKSNGLWIDDTVDTEVA